MILGADLGVRQKARFGIYIHVPFCAKICPYCDFVKTGKFSKTDVDVFFDLLGQSLVTGLNSIPTDWVEQHGNACTIYFGGGTPGMFPASRLAPLIALVGSRFEVEECTVECNPAARKRFDELRAAGVTRVTLGVQSLCADVLQTLGRAHTPGMALEAVTAAREAGFEEVQSDLIFGLKAGLRQMDIEEEVRVLEGAGATGISGYALSLEPRTRLWGSGLADEDSAVAEYPRLREACGSVGFEQRETANFSRFETRHNNIYWHGWPYFGLGTGAHGLSFSSQEHLWGRRYRIGKTPQEQAPGNDFLPFSSQGAELFLPSWEEPRSAADVLVETVYTLLRTPGGVSWRWIAECMAQCGSEFTQEKVLKDAKIARGLSEARLATDGEGVRLVGNEFLLGDGWAAHILGLLSLKP